MRNFYLFEQALKVSSVNALEQGLNNLNNLLLNRNQDKDFFFCNPSVWQCDTSQGFIYDLFGGIVNEELQRVIPFIFSSFTEQAVVYSNHIQLDSTYPNDCNAFTGFEFSPLTIPIDRQVTNQTTYKVFVNACLKYGVINSVAKMQENLTTLYPNLTFSSRAVQESLDWKNSNRGLYDRLFDLLDDIAKNPFTGGIGETEVLRHMSGVASKRINQAHRVTYKLEGNTTTILACSGHYD